MSELATREGLIEVPGGKVWFKVVGDGPGVPLLTLHGGPGFCHNYLLSLEDLADERPVIFYDQLGCGKSDRSDDASLWTVERFVAELQDVVKGLDLDRYHLLGQSWGTMLATDFALTSPAGLRSLILASPPLSCPRWVSDCTAYRNQLPAITQAVLDKHEADGTVDSPEYEAATMVFYQRHLCRMNPWPAPLNESLAGAGLNVYNTMWGPTEFNMRGSVLEHYDRTPDLPALAKWPVLFTCGRFDEATPEATAWYQSLVPGSELAVFEQSSHASHLEEREAYMTVAREFLRKVDTA